MKSKPKDKKNLMKLCVMNDYSLRKLSKDTGISLTYLSNLNRGMYTNPTLDVLKKISKVLNVSMEDVATVISREE